MITTTNLLPAAVLELALLLSGSQEPAPPLRVVTTLPYVAEVAKAIGGDEVEAASLVAPGIDPHHVELTPGQLTELRRADLFLENGMQLEAWAPRALEATQRMELAPGGPAHSYVTNGIAPLEIPSEAEIAAGGHVHAAGNPHVWLDPLNLGVVARNVSTALGRVRPESQERFEERRAAFQRRLDVAFFGAELVALLGGRTLRSLHASGRLFAVLDAREHEGSPLSERLGGWLGRARALPDPRVFSYHSTWSYLARSLGLEVVGTLEEKPGIPPGPAHLAQLVGLARERGITLVISPPYYPTARVAGFAEQIGGRLALLPTQPGEAEGAGGLFSMYDTILESLEGPSGGGR